MDRIDEAEDGPLAQDIRFALGRLSGQIEALEKRVTQMGKRLSVMEAAQNTTATAISDARAGVATLGSAVRILTAAAGVVSAVIAASITIYHYLTAGKV